MAIFLFSDFIPLKNKYSPNRPYKIPKGSDLNHPAVPLRTIGSDMANNMEAMSPAESPANNLTNTNITITVNDPIIAGNKMVKSYKLELPPKI